MPPQPKTAARESELSLALLPPVSPKRAVEHRPSSSTESSGGSTPAPCGGFRPASPAEKRTWLGSSRRNARGARAHASRSPIRNSSARSSRMCGSTPGPPSLAGAEPRRPEAHEAQPELPSRRRPARGARIVGQFAGEDGGLGLAVEASRRRSPRPPAACRRCAADARRPAVTLASRVARTEASATTSTRAPANSARLRARATSRAASPPAGRGSLWCRWSALVAANRMRSIRGANRPSSSELRARAGRRRARRRAPSPDRATAAGPALSAAARRRARSAGRAGRNGRGRTAARRARLIGLVAPLHHGGERARLSPPSAGDVERRESQRRRALEVAGHQEAAGRQRRQRTARRRGRRADRR